MVSYRILNSISLAEKRLIHKVLGNSRNISSNAFIGMQLNLSDEVKQAINDNVPVVSLESTIITHGMPFPLNLEMARKVETEIRNHGAVPATIGILKGIPTIGLSDQELEFMSQSDAVKVSRRDLAYVLANRLNGGTTVASTMILSKLVGIDIFTTGGIGGVHKDGQNTMDVSADLDELGKTDVTVICAGPKAILDIERTLEYLETKGVFVGTLGESGVNLPGFFTRDSGITSPYNFADFKEAANIVYQGKKLGLGSGNLFCIPPPAETSMAKSEIMGVIEAVEEKARQLGIKGKELTPFLLGEIAKQTKAKSVQANIELVLSNARAGAGIAKELSKLKGSATSFQPSILFSEMSPSTRLSKRGQNLDTKKVEKTEFPELAESIVIGSIALDTICALDTYNNGDSNPGKATSSVGGVGYNVALAATYASNNTNYNTRLISSIGTDIASKSILKSLAEKKIDISGLELTPNFGTAQYIALHKPDGDLSIACADMDIIESMSEEHVLNQINRSFAQACVFDANLSPKLMKKILNSCNSKDMKIVFEPTSGEKSKKIAAINLGVYPHNELDLITPTFDELNAIHKSFSENEKFDLNSWFPVIEGLGINSFRNDMELCARRNSFFKSCLDKGVPQQAIQLLPFFRNIIVKAGPSGILWFNISDNTNMIPEFIRSSDDSAGFTIFSKGKRFGDNQVGVVIQYYPGLDAGEIVNVTGCGDSFTGALLAEVVNNPQLLEDIVNERSTAVNKAQLAAVLTLGSSSSVSENISNLVDASKRFNITLT